MNCPVRRAMEKPARLEINLNGVWNLIALFDAADAEQTPEVLDKAAELASVLIWDASTDNKRLQLRVAVNDSFRTTVCTWSYGDGWRDPRTGDPL